MMIRPRRCADTVIGLAGLTVMLISVAPADAQIHSWRDADGIRVLSDRPPSPEVDAITVAVAGTNHIRATRVVTSEDAPARYDTLIRHHAMQHGVRPDLIRAVIQVESGFDPNARSPVEGISRESERRLDTARSNARLPPVSRSTRPPKRSTGDKCRCTRISTLRRVTSTSPRQDVSGVPWRPHKHAPSRCLA